MQDVLLTLCCQSNLEQLLMAPTNPERTWQVLEMYVTRDPEIFQVDKRDKGPHIDLGNLWGQYARSLLKGLHSTVQPSE